jgi:hypothetical protein
VCWSLFHGYCLGNALSKVYQYVITQEKLSWGLIYAFVKGAQANNKKCITWPKTFNKGKQALAP